MEKQEYIVCMDGDGHFHLAKVNNRKECLKAIKNIHDGDYYANIIGNEIADDFEDTYLTITEKEWREALNFFVQRATLEIITLE